MPNSVTILEAAPADAAGIARVHVGSWRTTYPGIMPQAHLDALSVDERQQTWRTRLSQVNAAKSPVFVAVTEGGEIVGFAQGGKERGGDADYLGEISSLYLLQTHQGKGLGRQLVQTLARRLAKLGYSTMLIWVNADNAPARRFYEALGGVAARTGRRTLQGVTYDDIGYGWNEDAFRCLREKQLRKNN